MEFIKEIKLTIPELSLIKMALRDVVEEYRKEVNDHAHQSIALDAEKLLSDLEEVE